MKRAWTWIIVGVAVGLGAYALFGRARGSGDDVEFRYAPVERRELVRSISATGSLVAETKVDVRSKAGGRIEKLLVDEGSVVRRGDLIAIIDPSDTRAAYEQAEADLQAASARAAQARLSAQLQQLSSANAVREAEVALALARSRLERAKKDAEMQPRLSLAAIQSAEAQVRAQEEALRQLETVTVPQLRSDARAALEKAKADLSAAEANEQRQKLLLDQGFVSRAEYERAMTQLAAARAAHVNAEERARTLEAQIAADLEALRARLDQARAALDQARTNQGQDEIVRRLLREAEDQVRQAELNLQRARNERLNVDVRRAEIQSAAASTLRSRVSLQNAKVQLDSTTVVAPRDGVVTTRYLEEGTIIPPGTSAFSEGARIIEISDTTRMFVEVPVDEADIAQVRLGQDVRITLEAYPGRRLAGVVRRINPSATTQNNVTAIRVRVEILPVEDEGVQLLPGMNATCEFMTLAKPNVLIVPSQAVRREQGKTFVRVKAPGGGPPIRREVRIGEAGNDGVEVLDGLSEGEEVVVAEIDLRELRQRQERIQQAQKGGGLAGGTPAAPRR